MRKELFAVVILFTVLALFYSMSALQSPRASNPDLMINDKVFSPQFARELGNDKEKAARMDEPQAFAEYHRGIRTRDGEAAPTYSMNYQINALLKARGVTSTQALGKLQARQKLDWIARGPGNVSGRTRSIIVDPTDPTFNTWLVGSVSGGVWRTRDAGKTWQELTAGLTNLATSAMAMAASNPNVIYAGTGEGFNNSDQVSGNGVWKSTDRGQTWQQLASTVNNTFRHVTRVIVDPQNENVVLVSTTRGFRSDGANGIYRSTDGGQNWARVYDAVGSSVEQIIANPQNFKTQYATVNGIGVIKSIDGGTTWNPSTTGIFDVGRMELAMAPADTSRLYVSAESGTAKLYISENAGATWALTKPEDNNNSIDFLGGQGWYDNTIAVHPYNKDIVFAGGASIWKFDIKAGTALSERMVVGVDYENIASFLEFVNSGGQLAGGGISINTSIPVKDQPSLEIRFGPGKSQKAHRFTVPAGSTSGVPAASYTYRDYVEVPFEIWDVDNNRQLMASFRDQLADGKFNLDADIDRSREYIFPQLVPYSTTPSVDIAKTAGHTLQQLYLVWAKLPEGSGWNPNLPNATLRIRWGTLTTKNMARSALVDVYEQFGGNSKGAHPDHHNIVLIPTNAAQQQFWMLVANDGGLAFSMDNGASFSQTGYSFYFRTSGPSRPLTAYPTTQFYGLDKMNGADRYIGGTQDNGTWVSPNNPNATTAWMSAPSGDGFEAVWHYRDGNQLLESSQYNNIFFSFNGGATWSNASPPDVGSTLGPFFTKIAKSKQAPDLVFATGASGLWRSENFARTWNLIEMPPGFLGNSYYSQVKISLASPDVVWAGNAMRTGTPLYVSTDGGLSFRLTNIYSPSLQGVITGIATHPTDERTAYAFFSFAGAPKILRTTDLGQTWEDISGFGSNATSANGFPDVGTFSLLVMPYDPNILWAGTDIGIFESTNGGKTWAYADNGLPPVPVYEMLIVNDEVVVATHGRGIWTVSLPQLAGYEPPVPILYPRLKSVSGGVAGVVEASLALRAAYDSSFVLVDGAKYLRLAANSAARDTAVTVVIPLSASQQIKISLLAYRLGKTYQSAELPQTLTPLQQAVVKYSQNFNSPEVDGSYEDFALQGLDFSREAGFTNSALSSGHPYQPNSNLTAVLLKPIIVAPGNATLQYDEVALVEPNNDYAVVEGSADQGRTWKALVPPYDARADARWLSAYNANQTGAATLFKKRSLNLLDTFSPGERVIIRFRLFSGPAKTSWGWVIDNLDIQPNASAVAAAEAALPTVFNLAQNYPNPSNPSTTIKYALPKNSDVQLVIYNASGQKVRTLVDAARQAAGYHEIIWNGANDAGQPVASGVYFYKLIAGNYVRALKMLVVK
ncbi:MAG: hypothetical protein ALAOOOJD_01091 [bacterium]|nr:hypothetical protein [bacterium]